MYSENINWSKEDIELSIKSKEWNKKINDETMLMHSVKVNDFNLAKRLIDLGADTSIGDYQNRTPLWLCTIYNRKEIAELLIKSGASMEEEYGHNSPLYNAIKHDNNEVAKILIDLGADLDITNRDHQTPLHCAVFRKNYEIIEYLLINGAKADIKNNIKVLPGQIFFEPLKSQTPYEMALYINDKRIIDLFDNYKQKIKNKIFDKIISMSELEKDFGEAILENNLELLKLMLENGFSPNFKINGYDVFELISEQKNSNIKKIIKLLDKYGLDLREHKLCFDEEINDFINQTVNSKKEH